MKVHQEEVKSVFIIKPLFIMKKYFLGGFATLSVLLVVGGLFFAKSASAEEPCTHEVGYLRITCLGDDSWCYIHYPDGTIRCRGDHAIIEEIEEEEPEEP